MSEIGVAAMSDAHLELRGPRMPVDHGYLLFRELLRLLPWIEDEALLGIHPVHGADSGAGELMLNRRTKLVVRCPAGRLDELTKLNGRTIHLERQELVIGACKVKPLSRYTPLYAHCVVTGNADEREFTLDIMRMLSQMGINSRFICGRPQRVFDGRDIVSGYSLLLHSLPLEHAIHMQQQGLGAHRKLGCGIFIPHKSIAAVGAIGSV
ncbi:MAG TPA: type I-MYXAN CRISPR-associated protein Cas6/Cmx6 [Sulfuriferula sp.]|nr:type I-MYXAN CRISPR-associated protein Cas6/Cmx6 [Sulfuriferula sp.]